MYEEQVVKWREVELYVDNLMDDAWSAGAGKSEKDILCLILMAVQQKRIEWEKIVQPDLFASTY